MFAHFACMSIVTTQMKLQHLIKKFMNRCISFHYSKAETMQMLAKVVEIGFTPDNCIFLKEILYEITLQGISFNLDNHDTKNQ